MEQLYTLTFRSLSPQQARKQGTVGFTRGTASGPKERKWTSVHTHVHVRNISRKEQCGQERGGESHSWCPTHSPLPLSCVHKNHRTKDRREDSVQSALFKNSCPATYLTVAGVGPILLKPRDDITKGKRRENVSQVARCSPVTSPPSTRATSR